MPTYDESWTGRLRVIGDLERPDHHLLRADDECFFMGSYTANAGYGHSSTNNLVQNLKKPMARRDQSGWRYKGIAIREAAQAIRANLNEAALRATTIIPIPPSSPKGSDAYDDRMVQVARLIAPNGDVRELLVTSKQRETRHTSVQRRDPDELRDTIGIDPAFKKPKPSQIILLDDVLTTGCSFRVCKAILGEMWPDVPVFGLFIARVARPQVDFDFDDFA